MLKDQLPGGSRAFFGDTSSLDIPHTHQRTDVNRPDTIYLVSGIKWNQCPDSSRVNLMKKQ